MSDPKDELGARFNERKANNTDDSNNSSVSGDTDDTDNVGNADNSNNTGSKPGPDPSPNSTRNRRQVPMYLPESKADQLNSLYERLDGKSKIAGEGGIEKHADFMESLVEFVVENEDELSARLGIDGE